MYLTSQLTWDVVVPPANIDSEGLTLQRAILVRIMDDFATKKTSKDLGYHLAVTTLDHIGEGKIEQHSGDTVFPVTFSCITFKMLMGEVLDGTVHKILKHGVFLKCGPADKVFLSHVKMTGYQYMLGEKPVFKNEKGSTIEKGTVVRFVVISEKYFEDESDFRALVSMDGEFLGPV